MSSLQQPVVNIATRSLQREIGVGDPRTLIIAQTTVDNNHGTLHKNPSLHGLEDLFGDTSSAYYAYRKYRDIDPSGDVHVLTVKNPTGLTLSKGGINITGSAISSGTLKFWIADDYFQYSVDVLRGESASDIAAKIVAEINKYKAPFTAVVNNTNVKITLTFGGNNGFISRIENNVQGVAFEVVDGAGAAAGSYSSNDTKDLLTNLEYRYHSVIFDAMVSDTAVDDFLQSRLDVKNEIKTGVGFTMFMGYLEDIKLNARTWNSKTLVIFANPHPVGGVYKSKFNMLPILFLAEFAAIRALRLTEGANIVSYVLNLDEALGGIEKATLPYHRTPLTYRNSIDNREISLEELENANKNGVSIINNSGVIGSELGAVLTTYRLNEQNQEDNTFKYLNAIDTMIVCNEYFFNNLKSQYAQVRLTQGELIPGLAMCNAEMIRASLLSWYNQLAERGITVYSAEAVSTFNDGLEITNIDDNAGFIVRIRHLPVVSQLRKLVLFINQTYEIN